MPIIKYKDKLIHFAHIPKCAGTSIEHYLSSLNGVEIAFIDEKFLQRGSNNQWNRSSPQHIDGKSLSRIFPVSFFDAFFAIVRNPVSRVISAYNFQKNREKKINDYISLDEFINDELIHKYNELGWLDNHFLPQTLFFYPNVNYKIFKLEQNGPANAKVFLDEYLFNNIVESKMMQKNKSKDNFKEKISQKSLSILHEIYAKDFRSFGYSID